MSTTPRKLYVLVSRKSPYGVDPECDVFLRHADASQEADARNANAYHCGVVVNDRDVLLDDYRVETFVKGD